VTSGDPTATRELFEHDRVAAGYASARPYLHPHAFARVREQLACEAKAARALDVGCGTGMSSLALTALAHDVVGTDASLPMLRRARREPRVRYAAATAEALPFREGSFDLVVACGSIDWVDRGRFLPRAFELLVSGGLLVCLDFGDTGRSRDIPGLAAWYDSAFQGRYPRPPASDPIVTPGEATRCGYEPPTRSDFSIDHAMSARQYSEFLMTESNVIAAVEYGSQAAGQVRARLESELSSLFGGAPRRIAFAGYVQTLRKP
jgi:SAM-dependent methyltransferase